MSDTLKQHDFVVSIVVNGANPNGDPSNENRPRTALDGGYGEISQMCIKRKIRNALYYSGEKLFIVSDELVNDDKYSIEERTSEILKGATSAVERKKSMLENFIDARLFGFVIAIPKPKDSKKSKRGESASDDADGASVSCNTRGAVSIVDARSTTPIDIEEVNITKSTNGSKTADNKKSSDTMGGCYYKTSGVYVFYGSVNRFWGEKNMVTEDDVKKLQNAIMNMFENDISISRPAGSMSIGGIAWWTQEPEGEKYSIKTLRDSVTINDDDGKITLVENKALNIKPTILI